MKSVLSYLGVALAALAASACCWIPALLGTAAASSLRVSAALAPWRPFLLGLTAIFLISGFWMVYRSPKGVCSDGDACSTESAARRRKVNIGIMWAVALFAVATAAFPQVQAVRYRASHAAMPSTKAEGREVVLDVKGMDCEACSVPLEKNLAKVPGVVAARVDFPNSRALVRLGKPEPSDTSLLKAVEESGFQATIEQSKETRP